MNEAESIFLKRMKGEGKTLIEQPYIKQYRLRPDFYCVEDETYYEVINTRQAFYTRRAKIMAAIEAGIKIKIVTPEGKPYRLAYTQAIEIATQVELSKDFRVSITEKSKEKAEIKSEKEKKRIANRNSCHKCNAPLNSNNWYKSCREQKSYVCIPCIKAYYREHHKKHYCKRGRSETNQKRF